MQQSLVDCHNQEIPIALEARNQEGDYYNVYAISSCLDFAQIPSKIIYYFQSFDLRSGTGKNLTLHEDFYETNSISWLCGDYAISKNQLIIISDNCNVTSTTFMNINKSCAIYYYDIGKDCDQ
jgi:hypothetical protein